MKYDEVNDQVLQRSRQNDDIVMEVLNLFALFLNSGDYEPYHMLPEVKEKLNMAMNEYETLMRNLHLNSIHNINTKKKYDELKDKLRDNIDA